MAAVLWSRGYSWHQLFTRANRRSSLVTWQSYLDVPLDCREVVFFLFECWVDGLIPYSKYVSVLFSGCSGLKGMMADEVLYTILQSQKVFGGCVKKIFSVTLDNSFFGFSSTLQDLFVSATCWLGPRTDQTKCTVGWSACEVANVDDNITAISFVALGTSVPDRHCLSQIGTWRRTNTSRFVLKGLLSIWLSGTRS